MADAAAMAAGEFVPALSGTRNTGLRGGWISRSLNPGYALDMRGKTLGASRRSKLAFDADSPAIL